MSCSEIRNAALGIHLSCLDNFMYCTNIVSQIQALDCYETLNFNTDDDPITYGTCASLNQSLLECNFINGAGIYSWAARDLWTAYVDKKCNVIDGNLCSIYISGVNVYDPCIRNSPNAVVDYTNSYVCTVRSIDTPAASDPAPSAPPILAPQVPSIPAPPAPTILVPQVPSIPAPPAPTILVPQVPSIPAPPAPTILVPQVPSAPAAPVPPTPRAPVMPGSPVPSILVPSTKPSIALLAPDEIYTNRLIQSLV